MLVIFFNFFIYQKNYKVFFKQYLVLHSTKLRVSKVAVCCFSWGIIPYAGKLTCITNKNLKNALKRFSDKSVFSGNAAAVVLKNGAALIFANFFASFFQHCTVYFLAHFCPVAFFRQMIALKITLKKTHF
jgi:hypothetical protein